MAALTLPYLTSLYRPLTTRLITNDSNYSPLTKYLMQKNRPHLITHHSPFTTNHQTTQAAHYQHCSALPRLTLPNGRNLNWQLFPFLTFPCHLLTTHLTLLCLTKRKEVELVIPSRLLGRRGEGRGEGQTGRQRKISYFLITF